MAANRSVMVTGASTGIGWGTVKVLLARGFQVFGTVRKQSDADRLANEFGGAFTPLLMDVTDHAAVARAAEHVGASLGRQRLAGLVNPANWTVGGERLSPGLLERAYFKNLDSLGSRKWNRHTADPLLFCESAKIFVADHGV
jgi:NAD(P)-dependent dehydrogenase (short-subunit alcohol dehydrogenase family)